MCGIFGLVIHKDSDYSAPFVKKTLKCLARYSESRGKDSSGLVFRNVDKKNMRIFKGAVPLSYLFKTKDVAEQLNRALKGWNRTDGNGRQTFASMGHSRLVTNGSQINDANNQPVIKDGIVGIHNGIIVNDNELWNLYPDITRTSEIDTEVMLALVRKHLRNNNDVITAVSETINNIYGTVTAAFLFEDTPVLVMCTNNGSLYILHTNAGLFAFASEEHFLKEISQRMNISLGGDHSIKQVSPGTGCVLSLDDFALQSFSFQKTKKQFINVRSEIEPFEIVVSSITNAAPQKELILDPALIAIHPKAVVQSKLLEFNIERIRALKRCSKCLLPETFPFIKYDEKGVCNYCKNYKLKNQPKPIEELIELVDQYRKRDGSPDCIIPYSGGRDSTHTLHIAKNVLKLNPIAFTYDWGMVTDLARRNIARVCGKLGVENILVSADISWKRENIRRNIVAWLKNPHLGMVPLFMAGDKFFYYYADQVKKQTGIRLNIWGINPLENTDFKVGFLGVPPDFQKKRIYSLSLKRQMRLFQSVGISILRNPKYLNRSVWNTLGSFVSRMMVPHRDYYHMYDYVRWDEQEIEDLVLKEYNWETAVDTRTTWRIGDGTAPFYNYIYYTVAGFSEHDTFRSNQIREGAMRREEALKHIEEENRPRYPSIKWYTDIVNIDFESTIKRINEIPKLYQ